MRMIATKISKGTGGRASGRMISYLHYGRFNDEWGDGRSGERIID